MNRRLLTIALATLLAGCATTAPEPAADVLPFSANRPGVELPRGWRPFIIARHKPLTRYDLVVDAQTQRVVLHAVSERSASGLKQRLDIDSAVRPWIAWRWRVVRLLPDADLGSRHGDDAPVRLLLFFDGNRDTLPLRERVLMETARAISGQPVPFATLMYVWDNGNAEGTVLPHPVTGQLKMIVAGSGADRLGQWKRFERNYVEDYRRAFGSTPGRLVGVGILTDTDNTGGSVEAFYGDIFVRASPVFGEP